MCNISKIITTKTPELPEWSGDKCISLVLMWPVVQSQLLSLTLSDL